MNEGINNIVDESGFEVGVANTRDIDPNPDITNRVEVATRAKIDAAKIKKLISERSAIFSEVELNYSQLKAEIAFLRLHYYVLLNLPVSDEDKKVYNDNVERFSYLFNGD